MTFRTYTHRNKMVELFSKGPNNFGVILCV